MTARDFPQELRELRGFYARGRITGRECPDRAGKFAVGGMPAMALPDLLKPDLLQPDHALARQVPADDPSILARDIPYPSPEGHGTVNGYLVRPAGVDRAPGVVVVRENRALNPYIRDVARRVAKAGFVALAPDGLTSLGGYPGDDDRGRELQQSVDPVKLMNDFFAAVNFLATHDATTGNVGIVGFCCGGGVANAAAVAFPDLGAAVAFYGRQPAPEDVARIRAPLLLHYAELDARINAGWPAYEAALKAAGTRYEAHIYPGVNHGFHNDTTPRYDRAAAELAWERTIAFFRANLT